MAQLGKFLRSFDLAQQAKNWELHWPDLAPETDDVIAAALACDACKNAHCPALLVRDTKPKSEWIDPPTPAEAAGQGDGDDGN